MASIPKDLMNPPRFTNFLCEFRKTFPSIAAVGFARCETPFLTCSCVCPDFASVSRCVLTTNLRFSFPVSKDLHFECYLVASLESGCWLVFAICFQTHVETRHMFAHILRKIFLRTQHIVRHQIKKVWASPSPNTKISASPSPNVLPKFFLVLFDTALCTRCFLFDRTQWLQENIEKFMKFNQRRRWFNSSRVKLPSLNTSASWFLVSTYLIRIFESKLILSSNPSFATLWVLYTCLIVGLLPPMIILIPASC